MTTKDNRLALSRERDSDGLTPLQGAFVRAYLDCGGFVKAAAQVVGIHPDNGSRMLRYPHVMAAITAERERIIHGDLAAMSLGAMRELLTSPDTPAHVRFQAARWCLEAAGHRAQVADPPRTGRTMSEMTIEELDNFMRQAQATLDALKPIDTPTIR